LVIKTVIRDYFYLFNFFKTVQLLIFPNTPITYLYSGPSPAIEAGLDPTYPAWSLAQPSNQACSSKHM